MSDSAISVKNLSITLSGGYLTLDNFSSELNQGSVAGYILVALIIGSFTIKRQE